MTKMPSVEYSLGNIESSVKILDSTISPDPRAFSTYQSLGSSEVAGSLSATILGN